MLVVKKEIMANDCHFYISKIHLGTFKTCTLCCFHTQIKRLKASIGGDGRHFPSQPQKEKCIHWPSRSSKGHQR